MALIDKQTILLKYIQKNGYMGGIKQFFFPIVHKHKRQRVDVNSYLAKRGRAPFIVGATKNLKRNDITSTAYEIPEMGLQTTITDKSLQVILPGTTPYSFEDTMEPAELEGFVEGTEEIRSDVLRTQDIMSSEVMTTGKVNLSNSTSIDFNREDKYNITADWSDVTSDGPTTTMNEFFELAHEANLPQSDFVLLLGSKAHAAFWRNNSIKSVLDNRRYESGKFDPMTMLGSTLSETGTFIFPELPIKIRVLSYTETYEAENGDILPIFPDTSAVFTSMQSPRHSFYGGVSNTVDEGDNSMQIVYEGDECIFDSYSDKSQRATFKRGISRFLPVPSNVNHLIHANVAV